MLPIKDDEIKRWRIEIDQAEKFRDEEFGSCEKSQIKGVGENVSYFETGYSSRFLEDYNVVNAFTPLNIMYPIVKNVIPSLYYKNPYVTCIPKRKEDEMGAPYVAALINYYFRQLNIKRVNQQVIFDAYVLGMGVCKIGYATKFGMDIPDDNIEKERKKNKINQILETLRLKKPSKPEEPPENIEQNEYIISENPYAIYVNPFNFGIDPSATSIYEANYVYEKVRKSVYSVKHNKNYSNTKDLQGIDIDSRYTKDLPQTQIDRFKPIDLYEVHYKTDEGINTLVLAKDQGEYVALRHEENPYEIDGFQYEILTFNKHGHKLYPRSDVDISKGLQDRINITFENVLDQVDKFMTKLAYDENKVTEQGKLALRDGMLGSIVACNADPAGIFKELSMTQVKADLVAIIDKMIDMITLETGVTKAMLLGMSTAETATEAQIQQAGSNLRISDKADMVAEYSNFQARKLWQVIRQFVDLEEVELITGDSSFDDVTGTPRYKWLAPVDPQLAEKLIKGEYDFQIEVGSTQKPDIAILRKQVENMANILGGKGVLEAFAAQGYRIELAEIFKSYLQLFPDVFPNVGRIIKPIQSPQQAGIPGMVPPQQGGMQTGTGAQPQMLQANPPNSGDIVSEIGGEKGNLGGIA